MQFAINWSPEAADLLSTNQIQVDLFKCPNWDALLTDAQAQLASYVHFPLVIGVGQRPSWDFDRIQRHLASTSTRFVNCHIAPNSAQFADEITQEDLLPALIDEVQTLVNEFGAERVIIENCPLFAGNVGKGYLTQGVQPAIFHEIIAATNCGFLMDMAHAYLVSDFLDLDYEQYICSLPTQHIREFHITGIGEWSNGFYGDHMPLTEDDWQRFEFCIDQFKSGVWRTPEVIAFEYGGIAMLKDLCGSDKEAIAQQVPRLYQLAHSTG